MKRKSQHGVGEERAGFRGDADSQSTGEKDWGDDWVHELIHVANGAGEGVFEEEPQPLRDFRL